MAVRHGYGKIAGTDALVFAYDTGDTRNSYRGEPTTNLYGNWNAYTGGSYEVLDNNTNYIKLLASAGTPWAGQFTAAVSAGTYTVSFQHRTDDGGSNNFNIDNDTQDDNIWNANITTTTEWQTYTSTKTHTGTGNHLLYFRRNGGAGNIYIRNVQIELKSHATPFIKGTRSATQGLLDLTGNSTINLANVSFDANATMTWDGTDDFLSGAASINYPVSWTDAYTLECMVYVPSSAVWDNSFFSSLIMKGSYQGSHGLVRSNTNNQIGMWARGDNGAVAAYTSIVRDVWTHIVGVWTGDRTEIYKNGVLESFSGTARTGIPDGGPWRIGRSSAASGNQGNTFDGEIPIVKFYNRALTADEIRNNYNQYRTRFSI